MSNTITVVGNLTGEPELRFTQSGTAMMNCAIAANRRYQVNGEWQEETTFLNFTLWREQAENAAATFSKGMRVIATGRMSQKDWTDKEGNKRTSYDLVVDEIGPSIRWATAEVTKVNGKDNGVPTSQARAAAAPPVPAGYMDDEEPF